MQKVKSFLFGLLFIPGDILLHILGNNFELFRWFLSWTPAWMLNYSSKLRAWRAYEHAKQAVPAYANFLSERPQGNGAFSDIRATDKENYIKRFSTAARCVGGSIPLINTVVDESSGSSGTPYNWVRSLEERTISHGFVSYFGRYCFELENMFTINAFSMGSWASRCRRMVS
jgi:phenylacetate-coenzyme A ligase PaaK-like adenylate-forming protein